VNGYLHHLKNRLNVSGMKRAYLIDSYQMTAIWNGSQKGLKKVFAFKHNLKCLSKLTVFKIAIVLFVA